MILMCFNNIVLQTLVNLVSSNYEYNCSLVKIYVALQYAQYSALSAIPEVILNCVFTVVLRSIMSIYHG